MSYELVQSDTIGWMVQCTKCKVILGLLIEDDAEICLVKLPWRSRTVVLSLKVLKDHKC